MSMRRRTFLFVALGLTVWSLIATLTAAYYYAQYVETRRTFDELKSLVIKVNVLIDYGNETLDWHNATVIAGSTVFDALLSVTTNVEYTTTAYGVFVSSIDGIENIVDPPAPGRASGHAWLWYHWNTTALQWTDLLKASDAYVVKSDDSVAWRYESYSFSL